jgi:hypothetical protein
VKPTRSAKQTDISTVSWMWPCLALERADHPAVDALAQMGVESADQDRLECGVSCSASASKRSATSSSLSPACRNVLPKAAVTEAAIREVASPTTRVSSERTSK